MTIDEAIKMVKHEAERYDETAKRYDARDSLYGEDKAREYRKRCAEQWQIAGWLKELKELKGISALRSKEYQLPSGIALKFEYDHNEIGRISLAAMDALMSVISSVEVERERKE